MAKRFEYRVTDFGRAETPVPEGMRLMVITVNDEDWRVELEPDEEPTPELRQELEDQANVWGQTLEILHGKEIMESTKEE